MKLQLDSIFYTLEKQPIQLSLQDESHATLGKVLANILLTVREDKQFDPLKCYVLAQSFYTEKSFEIDSADLNKLIKMVETDKVFSPLILGQTLQYLNETNNK